MASNEFNMVTRSRKRMLMETTSSTESETPIKHPTPDVLSQRKTGNQVKKKKYRCSWEEGRAKNELTINLNVLNKSCGHSSPIVINLGNVLECAGMDSVVKCRKINENSGRKKITRYKPSVSSYDKIKEPSTSKGKEDSFNTFNPKSISTLEKKPQQTRRRNAKSAKRRLDLNVSSEAGSDNDSSIENRAIESQSFERQIEEPVQRFKGLIVNGDFSESHFEKEPVVRIHNLSAEEISKHLGRSGDGSDLSRVEDSFQENGSRNEVVNSHDDVPDSNDKNGLTENVCTVLQQNMLNCGLYQDDTVERHINEMKHVNEGNEINKQLEQVKDKCSVKDINVASKEVPPENGRSDCPSEMCGKYDRNKERSNSFSSCATLIRTPSLEQLLNLIEDVNSSHPKKKASANKEVDNAWRGNSTTDDSDVGDRLVIAEDGDMTVLNTSPVLLCTDQSKTHNNEISNVPNNTEIITKDREDLNSQNGKHLNNEMTEGTQRLTVEPNQTQKPQVKKRKCKTQNKNILEETKGSPIYVALSKQIVSIQVQCANKELEIRECMERGLTPKLRNKSLRKSLYEKESKDKLATPSSAKSKKSRSSKLCLEEDKPDEIVESERESIRSRLRSQTPIKRLNQTVGGIEQGSTPRQKRGMSKREFKTDATVTENTPSELKSLKPGGRKLSQAKTDKTPKRTDSIRPDESVTPKRRSRKIREESPVELMGSPERKEIDNQKCETPKRMSGNKKKKDKHGTEENAESQEGEGKIEIKNRNPSPKKNRKSLNTETEEEKSADTSEIAEEKGQSLSEKKEIKRNRKNEREESQAEKFAEDIQTSKAKKQTSTNSKRDEGGHYESNVKEIVQSPEKKKSNNEMEPDMSVDESELGNELQTNSSIEDCKIKRVEHDESFQRIKTSIASPSRSVEEAPKCTETESPRKSGKGPNTPKGDLSPVKKKKVQEVNLVSDESVTNSEAASFIGHEEKNEKKEQEGNAYEVGSSTFSTEFESESQTEADDENNLEASESSQNDVDVDDSNVSQLSDDFLNAIKEKKSEVNVVNKQIKEKKKKKKKNEKKKIKSFGDGYIPLDVAGPTKFSVVDQESVKNTPSRGRPFDLKNSLVYSPSVKRIPYSELLAYRMKTQVRRRTFK